MQLTRMANPHPEWLAGESRRAILFLALADRLNPAHALTAQRTTDVLMLVETPAGAKSTPVPHALEAICPSLRS